MGLPNEPLTLSPETIAELNTKLSRMRHDINNHLSLVIAAVELIRYKPEMREKMTATLVEQPARIIAEITKFSADFEKSLGIKRGS